MRLTILAQILLARLFELYEHAEWSFSPVERALTVVKKRIPLAITANNHGYL